ncbi:Exosome complex component rrp4 [Cucumispora dikerogammari]|nr:Exosome complex component rrp4 [Cucumispora dikerogammari]
MKPIKKDFYFPGEIIELEPDELHGHGLQIVNQKHIVTSFGVLSKIDKLVLIKPIFLCKYIPSVGDMIIGVVNQIGNKKWIVDINSIKCVLNTSAIIQPASDVKTDIVMRDYLNIGDIIVCEVQKVGRSVSVHTHHQNYGKRKGALIKVPVFLIINSMIFESKEKDLKILIGKNGFILISGDEDKKDKVIKYIEGCRKNIKIIKEEDILFFVSENSTSKRL